MWFYIYMCCVSMSRSKVISHESFFMFCTGNSFLVPGATVATILMLGALHVRRLYDDRKVIQCVMLDIGGL